MNSFLEGNHFVSNIKSISRVRNEIATTIHRNRPFHGLVLFTKGESVFKFQDGNTYFIKENQVIYLPKFSNYDSKDAENTECIAINFDIDDSNATFPVFCLSQEVGERYRHKFSKGFHLWSEHGTGYIHGSLSVLYDIIYQIQKDASRQYVSSRQSLFVDEATTFIHMHLTDHKLSVEMISQSLQITPEYLRRLFKAAKGNSPIQYIMEKRIELAKNLIATDEIKLCYIAEECGFNDYPYFSRVFKKLEGISPLQFLQKHRLLHEQMHPMASRPNG